MEAGYEFKEHFFFSTYFLLGTHVLADTYASKLKINSVQTITEVSMTFTCSVNVTEFKKWTEDTEVYG